MYFYAYTSLDLLDKMSKNLQFAWCSNVAAHGHLSIRRIVNALSALKKFVRPGSWLHNLHVLKEGSGKPGGRALPAIQVVGMDNVYPFFIQLGGV